VLTALGEIMFVENKILPMYSSSISLVVTSVYDFA